VQNASSKRGREPAGGQRKRRGVPVSTQGGLSRFIQKGKRLTTKPRYYLVKGGKVFQTMTTSEIPTMQRQYRKVPGRAGAACSLSVPAEKKKHKKPDSSSGIDRPTTHGQARHERGLPKTARWG